MDDGGILPSTNFLTSYDYLPVDGVIFDGQASSRYLLATITLLKKGGDRQPNSFENLVLNNIYAMLLYY